MPTGEESRTRWRTERQEEVSAEDKYRDQIRKCIDCGAEFNWSADEQERFHGLGLADPPKRCEECRQAWKRRNGDGRDSERLTGEKVSSLNND